MLLGLAGWGDVLGTGTQQAGASPGGGRVVVWTIAGIALVVLVTFGLRSLAER